MRRRKRSRRRIERERKGDGKWKEREEIERKKEAGYDSSEKSIEDKEGKRTKGRKGRYWGKMK